MYHSLIINGYNTWENWGLVPETRPLVAPPKVKTNYIDIPGADGALDYTSFQSGVHYQNREGSWKFIVHNDNTNGLTWAERYSQLIGYIHGKECIVVLEDDPAYFYRGRLAVDEWDSGRNWSTVSIEYNLEPYKNMTGSSSTSELDWLWDDLFDNIIYYGTFDVNGDKPRRLLNPTSNLLSVTATCSSAMTVVFNDQTITLPAGSSSGLILLQPGVNDMVFSGSGRVIIDYRIEGLI